MGSASKSSQDVHDSTTAAMRGETNLRGHTRDRRNAVLKEIANLQTKVLRVYCNAKEGSCKATRHNKASGCRPPSESAQYLLAEPEASRPKAA